MEQGTGKEQKTGAATKGDYRYMPAAVTDEVKAEIRRISREQRRSMSQQAGELIELGLAEYMRQAQLEDDVAAGRTQVNPEMVKR